MKKKPENRVSKTLRLRPDVVKRLNDLKGELGEQYNQYQAFSAGRLIEAVVLSGDFDRIIREHARQMGEGQSCTS